MSYKVLHYITDIDLSSGGPSRSMPSMCIGLNKIGINCEVYAQKTENPNNQQLQKYGIPVHLVERPSNAFESFFTKRLIDGVDLTNCIAHIQNIWDPALHKVAEECQKKGVPYVISPRGMLEPWSLKQKRWKKNPALWAYQLGDLKKASCIHTTAISEMEHVRALGVECPIAVIPNGIKTSDYTEKDYNAPRKGKKRMLFLSRIHPKKGIDLLLKAWDILPKELTTQWELVIAGEGGSDYTLDDLKAMIAKDFAHLDVIVAGPQYGEAKTKIYQSADIFVLPTWSENFGMVIAEAMCCGVPVITTTGTPWTELKEKNLGWYIDLSVESLKDALIDAMNRSDDELHDMGKRSREHIINEYSIEAVAYKYKALYGWLMGENDMPEFVYCLSPSKSKNILLMTATVNPNGLIDSSLQNVDIREEQYISTLKFYASQPDVDKIVFVENSGWDLKKMLQKSGVSPEIVECISLDCNNYPRELGKGYGEFQLIDKAIDLSKTLKANKNFVKVTGRFPVINISNMLKEFEKKDVDLYCDIVNHNIYDWLHTGWDDHHGRTVVYKASVDFYKKYFYGRFVECNDEIDHTAEWLMYDVAMSHRDNPNVILRFKTEPHPTGRAGHHVGGLIDTNDYDDNLSRIKRGIRQILRWTAPWLWF